MPLLARIARAYFNGRLKEIDNFRANPIETQEKQFSILMSELSKTEYGRERGVSQLSSYSEFCDSVALQDYTEFMSYIERSRQGESNIITPNEIEWYAKSSGTTACSSKYIPVPKKHLWRCHFRGTRDVLAITTDCYPEIGIFSGKTLTLGGSHTIDETSSNSHARYGDLSAIMIQNAPLVTKPLRLPSKKHALISDFEKKIELICKECVGKNITSIAGVPSWNMVMLNKVLEYTGKNNISEVWENLELFMHGGISFKPYREQFKKIIPSPKMKYIETYNASEGFFAIQDDPSKDDMLLMLDYGVFYEFLPLESINDKSKAIPLEGVKVGVNYAMIISTIGGLWRYEIGDTITFTSINPYKIKITGRTKLYINAFGEEVIIDNTDKAAQKACELTGASMVDYTVAPIYMNGKTKGSHQWVIEFSKPPTDMNLFTEILDKTLQYCNSDYEAKRANDTTLHMPTISIVKEGTFYRWMHSRNKLGGQNKVPRLSNERNIVEDILNFERE